MIEGNVTILLSVCIAVVFILIIIFALLLRFYKAPNTSGNRSNARNRETNSRGFGHGGWVEDAGYGRGGEEMDNMIQMEDANRERLFFSAPAPQSVDMVNVVSPPVPLVTPQHRQQPQQHNIILEQQTLQQQPTLPQSEQQPSVNILQQQMQNQQIQPQNIIMPQQQLTNVQKEVIYPGCENVLYAARPAYEMQNFVQPVQRFNLPPVPQILPQRPTLENQITPPVNTSQGTSYQDNHQQAKQQFVVVKHNTPPIKSAEGQKNFVQPVDRSGLPAIPQIIPQNLRMENPIGLHSNASQNSSPMDNTSPAREQFVLVKHTAGLPPIDTAPKLQKVKKHKKQIKKKKVPTATLR